MGIVFRNAAMLIAVLVLSACANDRMRVVDQPAAVAAPASDRATVVFLRPADLGSTVRSAMFDISDGATDFIGIVSGGRKVAYTSKPGQRRFMVIGETADFLDADLLPGKTYFARIEPRNGTWKTTFNLAPVPASSPKLEEDLKLCKWVDNTPTSTEWAKAHMASVRQKMSRYLPAWEKSPDKGLLKADAGR